MARGVNLPMCGGGGGGGVNGTVCPGSLPPLSRAALGTGNPIPGQSTRSAIYCKAESLAQ